MNEFFNCALHALTHTLEHTWYMLFMLFFVYLLIEFIEHRAMNKLRALLSNKNIGLIGASALGLLPQCGFSVAAANLYSERLISIGAVAAVFIATSDEALPILAASPEAVRWLVPTMLIKFVWAIAIGFFVNLIFKLTGLDKRAVTVHSHHGEHVHEGGEHHHCEHCDSERGILSAALTRTVSIYLFVFATSCLLNIVIDIIGSENLGVFLMNNSILQPIIAALVGLIPNCAASVITTELFVAGAIGYGSLVAALCSGAGVGMLVMFRVNRDHRQNLALLGILYAASSVLGIIIELIL